MVTKTNGMEQTYDKKFSGFKKKMESSTRMLEQKIQSIAKFCEENEKTGNRQQVQLSKIEDRLGDFASQIGVLHQKSSGASGDVAMYDDTELKTKDKQLQQKLDEI